MKKSLFIAGLMALALTACKIGEKPAASGSQAPAASAPVASGSEAPAASAPAASAPVGSK